MSPIWYDYVYVQGCLPVKRLWLIQSVKRKPAVIELAECHKMVIGAFNRLFG